MFTRPWQEYGTPTMIMAWRNSVERKLVIVFSCLPGGLGAALLQRRLGHQFRYLEQRDLGAGRLARPLRNCLRQTVDVAVHAIEDDLDLDAHRRILLRFAATGGRATRSRRSRRNL